METFDLRQSLIFYLCLLVGFCVHEWAHAFTADKLGDGTARALGRVTLNPLAHMDPLGSVGFPLVCLLLFKGAFLFAWGKPVPVNTSNFEPRLRVRNDLLVTLAGPASNLGLALLAAILGGTLAHVDQGLGHIALVFISVNVMLAVFNLLPVPPLDGSHVLRHLTRMSGETYLRLSRWGFLILIVLLNVPVVRAAFAFALDLVMFPFVNLLVLLAGAGAS
ncbi:MAG: site-2 protease family protein [Opitutaceae bacterium]|nr:site-2 protease family protein [Opitutaceae bacterium]